MAKKKTTLEVSEENNEFLEQDMGSSTQAEDAAGSPTEDGAEQAVLGDDTVEILAAEQLPTGDNPVPTEAGTDQAALESVGMARAELFLEQETTLLPTADVLDDAAIPLPEVSQPTEEAPTSEPHRPKKAAVPEQKSFYQLDFHELDRGLTPEQRQEWNSIYASFRGRSALTGEIIGIDRHAISTRDKATGVVKRQEMYCAIVVPFRVRILIPETEMWPRGEERPPFVLRNMVGARIDFIILHVDREGGFALASRKQALSSRRYYFSTQPSMNKVGARIKCGVLAVGPRRCLVSCYGHDVDLTQREMRYTAIPDLRDEYRPGQELDCIVKGYDREAGRLLLSVKETQPNPFDGAEQRHPLGCRRQAVIAGKYAGGVFCNLPDGAVVMCSYSYQYEDSAF
ncbi:MAG: hypothetical protein RSB55_08430, partial [Oscillospiraceae bacterium]